MGHNTRPSNPSKIRTVIQHKYKSKNGQPKKKKKNTTGYLSFIYALLLQTLPWKYQDFT